MKIKTRYSLLPTILTIGFFVMVFTGVFYIQFVSNFEPQIKLFLMSAFLAAAFFLSTLYLLIRPNFSQCEVDEAMMQENQSLFAELYQNSPVPYIRTDKNGLIIHANAAAVRLYGETSDQLVGRDLFASVRGEGKNAAHVSRLKQLVSSGNFANDQEVILTRSDKTERWVMLSAFPYANKTEILVTLVDITKQKNIDTAKSEFVSLASHQLRTPLSAIKWNLELLSSPKMGELNDKQHNFLAKVSRSAERMSLLIKDFLDASQLEMGTFSTTISEVKLTKFITDILEEFEAKIAQKNIKIQTQFPNTENLLETDEHLLHMTVNNLISNAVKYTPDGGTILVGYVPDVQAVSITVRDTGMGIPAEDQPKLFSKFYRATNVKPTLIDGTGIGLYIVKQAVDMMQGSITFDSNEGLGTEFVVTVPLGR